MKGSDDGQMPRKLEWVFCEFCGYKGDGDAVFYVYAGGSAAMCGSCAEAFYAGQQNPDLVPAEYERGDEEGDWVLVEDGDGEEN